MQVLVRASYLETLIAAAQNALAAGGLPDVQAAKTRIAVLAAEDAISASRAPDGVTPGRALGMAPAGVVSLYALELNKGDWDRDHGGHARAILSIARRLRPDMIPDDDVAPWQAEMPETREGYLSRLTVDLQRWGFHTLKTPDFWAFYAPDAVSPQPKASQAFAHAPG